MKILARIIALTVRHKWYLAGAYACMAGSTAAYLVLPWLFGNAVDKIALTVQGDTFSDRAFLSISVMILAFGSLRGILAFGQTYLGEALAQFVVYHLRNTFYNHVQHLSFEFHDRHHTGNLMSRAITDVEAIRMFVQGGVIRTPYFLIQFVAVAVILLRMDLVLGLVAMSFVPPVAIVAIVVRLQLGQLWRGIQEKMAELSTTLQENLSGVRVVKAFASEEHEEAKFDIENSSVAAEMIKAARLQAMNVGIMLTAYLTAMGLVLWLGGAQVIDGRLSHGELAQFLFYLQILSMPVMHSGMIVNSFARAISAGERLFEIIDLRSPVRESKGALEMPRVRGHVRFEDVSFGYNGRAPVIKNINIDVESGNVVALLGAPGSGKSTIAHLLPRFYDVSSGAISIDGTDIRSVTLASLRRNMGIVQQDVVLFTTSIRENIAYGRHDATTEEVENAARVAQLHEFIQSLPEGYETVIGERGATLSGGQRQRLSIARAVLLDPPVLILDDSTSSVDASTEDMIRKAMESVMRGRTTFVIAHRLSTVHKADEILVCRDGEIAERGSHQELLDTGGLYREIYDLQLRPQEQVMLEFDTAVASHKERAL